jgi:ABC-2 type transport system ATP-binding protein
VLELTDLARRYGDVVALDGVSFAVEPGQLFGFVGPNGAGKTTTMRIVLGVLRADRGEVRWRGEPIGAATRARFGYMPEERGLYPKMRVRDQLVHLARLHGLSAPDAGAAATHWIERLGLAPRARERIMRLSLGEQQRVQLAAALVHDPIALLLDEPFSGIDALGVDVLAQVLRERAARGIPVLFSTHQLDLVDRLCDAVAILRSGRIVAAGAVAELRVRRGRGAWRIAVEGAPPGWIEGVPGVQVVAEDGRGLLVSLDARADEQALLDAGRTAGRVVHFAREEPTLVDVFREVVAE